MAARFEITLTSKDLLDKGLKQFNGTWNHMKLKNHRRVLINCDLRGDILVANDVPEIGLNNKLKLKYSRSNNLLIITGNVDDAVNIITHNTNIIIEGNIGKHCNIIARGGSIIANQVGHDTTICATYGNIEITCASRGVTLYSENGSVKFRAIGKDCKIVQSKTGVEDKKYLYTGQDPAYSKEYAAFKGDEYICERFSGSLTKACVR